MAFQRTYDTRKRAGLIKRTIQDIYRDEEKMDAYMDAQYPLVKAGYDKDGNDKDGNTKSKNTKARCDLEGSKGTEEITLSADESLLTDYAVPETPEKKRVKKRIKRQDKKHMDIDHDAHEKEIYSRAYFWSNHMRHMRQSAALPVGTYKIGPWIPEKSRQGLEEQLKKKRKQHRDVSVCIRMLKEQEKQLRKGIASLELEILDHVPYLNKPCNGNDTRKKTLDNVHIGVAPIVDPPPPLPEALVPPPPDTSPSALPPLFQLAGLVGTL